MNSLVLLGLLTALDHLDCSLPCNILALLFPVCLETIHAIAQKNEKGINHPFLNLKRFKFWTGLYGDGVRSELLPLPS